MLPKIGGVKLRSGKEGNDYFAFYSRHYYVILLGTLEQNCVSA